MARRIKRAKIKFLSLVPKGANRLPPIYKSESGAFEVSLLTKGLTEKGELLAVVYAPEFRDSQGDIASAEVVKDMLYESARDGLEIDLRHDGKAIDRRKAFVAESFLIQKGDPRFVGLKDYDGNPVDPTGAWGVVVKIEDEGLRKLYREGAWRGVSMGGEGLFQTEKQDSDELAEKIAASLAKKLNPEEEDMTDEQIEKLTKGILEGVSRLVSPPTPAQAPAAQNNASPQAPPASPVFKGDPTCAEDVKTYREEVRKFNLSKRLAAARTGPEIDAILKELEGSPPSESDELKKAKEEAAAAQAKLARLQKASNQSPRDSGPSDSEQGYEGLSKEQVEAVKAGQEMAAWANKQRGY